MIRTRNFKSWRQRSAQLVAVAVLVIATLLANLLYASLAHASQVTTRFIEMSDSRASATDVTYTVGFKAGSSHTIKGIVVQFCSNSPLVNTACTAPAGFDSNYAGLAIANQVGISGFALAAATNGGTSNTNTIILTKAGGSAVVGGTTTVSFDLGSTGASDGITNPTATNTTFYARIVTYGGATGDTNAAGYLDTNVDVVGAHNDDGGIAISTANAITITSKVQETLTFCVYTGVNCAAGGTAVALGDANGVLANTALVYTDASSKFDLATNASAGAIVRMKGDTLKTPGGTFSIDPDLDVAGVCQPDSSANNIEQFGMRLTISALPLEPVTPYGCGAATHTFNPAFANTTYGVAIADTSGGALDVQTGTMEFAAKSALTTEAGIYSTTLIFIATATY
jgi:hypothetical protein